MKKIIQVLSLSLLLATSLTTKASSVDSQVVNLSPGWNVVSTPKILDSYLFSAPEISSNFDIYVLNASSTNGWSTLSDLGQTTFVPLFGYFINNKTTINQTLTFNYKENVDPASRLFDRLFTKSGWYSLGVSSPQYAKCIEAADTDTNNAYPILNSLIGGFDTFIDMTDVSTSSKIGNSWTSTTPTSLGLVNDLRETKGYAIYITGNSHYSGYQDNVSHCAEIVGNQSAEVTISQTPANNPNMQTNANVPVYGITFNAKQSDISVERINLQFSVTSNQNGTNTPENPGVLINSISVLDGSTVLQTIPVDQSTFTRITSGTSTNYYVQIAGLGFKVTKNTSKNLTFKVNTNSIDVERIMKVSVYGESGIRVVDTQGISNYPVFTNETRTHVFKKTPVYILTAKESDTPIYSSNYRVNRSSNGAEKVLTSTFALKSESGTSKIREVLVLIKVAGSTGQPSGTPPTTVYLYDGATLVDARSYVATSSTITSGTVTFDLTNSNVTVDTGVTKTFTIKIDMPETTATGTLVATQVIAVTYEQPSGYVDALSSLLIPTTAVYHYFAPVVAQLSKVSSTATVIRNGASNTVSSIEARFDMTITAQGGNIRASSPSTPIASISLIDTQTGVIASTQNAVAINEESGLNIYSDGSTKYITFQTGFATSTLTPGSTYKAVINSISYLVDGQPTTATTTLTNGFKALDTTTVTY